jgi:TMEM175 potassium channel family protein
MGENHFEAMPVALYGAILLMAGAAYFILTRVLIAHRGHKSHLAVALGSDRKGVMSLVLYAVAIPLALGGAMAAFAVYVLVAAIWFIPDRRIESVIGS